MGQLHQVARHFVWMLVAVAPHTSAQSFCSLTVRALYPDGQPADAMVSVQEKSGRIESVRQTAKDVRFCDLGALPVTVKVGLDSTCNQVVIHNVPLTWNATTHLTVTYDIDPCLVEKPPPPSPVCRIVFRIADTTGKWISGIPINLSAPAPTTLQTDEFGRASFLAKLGDRIDGSVDGEGYVPVSFNASCTRSEPLHEELLTLKERRGPGGR
jgi:hypothetical protein